MNDCIDFIQRIGLITVILLIVTGCSDTESAQSNTVSISTPLILPTEQIPTAEHLLDMPDPAVNFIEYLDPYPGERGDITQLICITVRSDIIYEPGDVATYGVNSTRFQLFVDGVSLPFAQANPMERDFDPKYDPIAKTNYYEGEQTGCLPILINPGLHLAEIRAVSTSGKLYSYKWAFKADTVLVATEAVHERLLGIFLER